MKIIQVINPIKMYTSKYGYHFTKELCDYALSFMTKNQQPIIPITLDALKGLFEKYDIPINDLDYDAVYLANMCKSDYLGSSILDYQHLCLYVKDSIEDEDADSSITFRRWVATMEGNDKQIDWLKFV